MRRRTIPGGHRRGDRGRCLIGERWVACSFVRRTPAGSTKVRLEESAGEAYPVGTEILVGAGEYRRGAS